MKRRVHLFISIHSLLALLVMLFISTLFPLPFNVFILHPLLVCSFYTLILYFFPSRLKISAVTAFSVLLSLFYISNIVAVQFWNELISWSFLLTNQEVILEELTKFPAWLVAVSIFLVYLLYIVYRSLLSAHAVRTRHFGILLVTPVMSIGFVSASQVISEEMDIIWKREPFYELTKSRHVEAQIQEELVTSRGTRPADNWESPPPNIILIHADALRYDRLGAHGYDRDNTPFVDQLIHKGAISIPVGLSNCSESMCGFSSVLSSSFDFHSASSGLLQVLSEHGYINNFIGAGSIYHNGLDRYLRPKVDNFLRADLDPGYYLHDDRYLLDVLDRYPAYREVPNVFYLRMMSPHGLGSHQFKYQKYHPTPESFLSMLGGESQRQALTNEHDNRARQFDDYMKTIFSTLEKKGYLDNAIVVIFGDHGDALGERGTYGHFQSLYQEEVHVPLIFWSSDNLDMQIDTDFFATLMDVPATLLYQLGLPIPDSFMGTPLQQPRSEKIAYMDSRRDTIGLVYQDANRLLKLIVDREDHSQVEVYDLRGDPGETKNLYKMHTDFAKMMIKKRLSVKGTEKSR